MFAKMSNRRDEMRCRLTDHWPNKGDIVILNIKKWKMHNLLQNRDASMVIRHLDSKLTTNSREKCLSTDLPAWSENVIIIF